MKSDKLRAQENVEMVRNTMRTITLGEIATRLDRILLRLAEVERTETCGAPSYERAEEQVEERRTCQHTAASSCA